MAEFGFEDRALWRKKIDETRRIEALKLAASVAQRSSNADVTTASILRLAGTFSDYIRGTD